VIKNAMIVDKASAILGYAKERTSLLNADHRGVCKFDQPTDPNYKTLRNAFITTVDDILSNGNNPPKHRKKFTHINQSLKQFRRRRNYSITGLRS